MIPINIQKGIDRYVKEHTHTGSFLYAVLTNNLRESFNRADEESLAHLKDIVQYCHWEIPSSCWGSVEKVEIWLKGGTA